jgi:hypothetical protein
MIFLCSSVDSVANYIGQDAGLNNCQPALIP